ncbi:oxysterol-binding protein 3, putative, partial [Ixodes scapularis]
RAVDWEIMQGLRSGQRCEDKPRKFEGYLLKRRKWPLKGWHKRFFCLEKGILTYAKSSTDMAKGKNHGSVDLGLSVISTKGKGRRVDIDAEEFIYHLKVKNQAQFQQWVPQLRHHRLYRQHEIAFGSREAPKMTSPAVEDTSTVPTPGESYSEQIHGASLSDFEKLTCGFYKQPARSGFSRGGPSFNQLYEEPCAKPANFSLGWLRSTIEPSTDLVNAVKSSLAVQSASVAVCLEVPSKKEALKPTESSPDTSLFSNSDGSFLFKESRHVSRLCGTYKMHTGLRTMLRGLQTERERLKQHIESENLPGGGGNAALVANLKNALSQALQQNYDLRACLRRIHEDSDPSSFPPPESPAGETSPFVSPQLVHPPLQQSVSHESSSALSTSEFFDAAEKLSQSSSSSEEEEEEGSFCSEVSDDGTEYAPGAGGDSGGRAPSTQGRRSKLPAPKPDAGDTSLWNLLCKNIGKDLSKVSMPVTINEPLNMLQRLCEELEYSDLLDKAASMEDPVDRMAITLAFALLSFKVTVFQFRLSLSFALLRLYNCLHFQLFCSQVNHHPPVSACYAESKNYKFWQDVRIKSKFWGKSMEILPVGSVHLELFSSNSHYEWNKVTTCVHNIFSGQRWVDQYGEMTIRDLTYEVTCKLTFVKASYWSDKRHEVFGTVVNKQGDVVCNLSGQWTEALYCGTAPTAKCIWRPGTMPEDFELYYGFTRFAIELNELDQQMAKLLPPTDSRFRPDQRLLEEGNISAAENVKSQLEQFQRERRKQREESGLDYQPMWFR